MTVRLQGFRTLKCLFFVTNLETSQLDCVQLKMRSEPRISVDRLSPFHTRADSSVTYVFV